MRIAATIAVILILSSEGVASSALANSTLDKLKAFGLTGAFSPDCSVEPSKGGRLSIWGTDAEERPQVITRGAGLTNGMQQPVSEVAVPIFSAKRISDSKLAIMTKVSGEIQRIVIEKIGDSYHNLEAVRASDGAKLIEDGIFLTSGERMSLMRPCHEGLQSAEAKAPSNRGAFQQQQIDCIQEYSPFKLIKCYKYRQCSVASRCEWQSVDIEAADPKVQSLIARVNDLVDHAGKGQLPSEDQLADLTKEGSKGFTPNASKENLNDTFRGLGEMAISYVRDQLKQKKRLAEAAMEKEELEETAQPGLIPSQGKWARIAELISGPAAAPVEVQAPFWVQNMRLLVWARWTPLGWPVSDQHWITVLLFIDCENLRNSVMTSLQFNHDLPSDGSMPLLAVKKISQSMAQNSGNYPVDVP